MSISMARYPRVSVVEGFDKWSSDGSLFFCVSNGKAPRIGVTSGSEQAREGGEQRKSLGRSYSVEGPNVVSRRLTISPLWPVFFFASESQMQHKAGRSPMANRRLLHRGRRREAEECAPRER